jgi:hypothetical protein
MISRRPDGWSWMRNFHICWTHVRTKLAERPDGCIWIVILALCMSASGRESTSSRRLHQSSLIRTWKENLKLIDHWTSSGRAAEMSGWMQAGTEASRCSEWSGQKSTSSRRMMLGLSGVRTDGTVDRWVSGRLTGNRLFWLQNLLKHFWIAESLIKQHLYIQVILSKQNEANHKLTNSLFSHSGTKITWPVWKYIPGLKIKITPPFCHTWTKGKTE